jgi:photosystem II stability/assembly factor-like uncharacterized protein
MKTRHIFVILLFVLLRPFASAQWVHASNPHGGPITCFSISGQNLFVGTTGSGVFRSSDNGTTWTPANAGLGTYGVWSLALAGTNLFAGTYGGGVFLSTDNGATWTSASDGLAEPHALALAVDGRNLFAGTLGGIFLSTDAGLTWSVVGDDLSNLYVRTLAVNRGRIYAGTYGGGVFVSTDTGETWTAANKGLTNTYVLDFAFLGSYIFAGTYGGVFRSAEDASLWEPVNLESIGKWSPDNTILEGKAIYSLVARDAALYVGTYGLGVLRSTNAGESWMPVNAGLGTLDFSVLSVCDTNFYVGTLGGEIWRRPVSEMIAGLEGPPNGLAANFVLEQNYPNPFNPFTIIQYTVGEVSDVVLMVYDMLGRQVAELVNANQAPGSYEVSFDASGLSSGVYFYRLTAGGFTQTRKMLVVK